MSKSLQTHTALIAGASGLVGKSLLYQLLEDSRYLQVIILVRNELAIKHPKLKQVRVDYNHPEEVASACKADDVFWCLGTTIRNAGSQEAFSRIDKEYAVTLGRIFREQGVKRMYVVSAMGANPGSAVFYNRVKGEMESELRLLEFETLVFFRPSLLLGSRNEFRPGEWVAQKVLKPLAFLFAGPARKYRPIAASQVAKAMLKEAHKEMPGIRVLENHKLFV